MIIIGNLKIGYGGEIELRPYMPRPMNLRTLFNCVSQFTGKF